MAPDQFRKDIRKSKSILEDIIGERILGYRAPSYSITKQTLWALDILVEEGFIYDSSIFPVRHDLYGIPDAPRTPFVVYSSGDHGFRFEPLKLDPTSPADTLSSTPDPDEPARFKIRNPKSEIRNLIEFPISTLRLAGQNLPVAGGGYFRLLPLALTTQALRFIQRGVSAPFVFYIHPWEIDPDQPRVKGLTFKSRFRHYLNLHKTENRLKKLLSLFPFTSFKNLLSQGFVT